MLKIATWNVNSLRVRLPHVLDWLASRQPDILALQETKMVDADFPIADFAAVGYQAVFAGQKTYNGVALLSRQSATNVVTHLPGMSDSQRRVLVADIGGIRVLNLYVPNGQAVGSDKYLYKLEWLESLTSFVATQQVECGRCLLLGDFNIAPEDRDVYDPQAWQGRILCSGAERKALKRLIELGFDDAFRLFEQKQGEFSWWDYRAAGFRRNHGLRIDIILVSAMLAKACVSCAIDKEPRAWQRPSDHAPVVAEFEL